MPPWLSSALITGLVRYHYTTHVRELEALLWKSMTRSPGHVLEPWPQLSAQAAEPKAKTGEPQQFVDPSSVGPEEIEAALERNNGSLAQTWKELGLSSHHVLHRPIRRYGIQAKRGGSEG